MDASLKKRIVSAFFAIIGLGLMLYFRGLALVIPGVVIMLIGVYEFNRAFSNIRYKPLTLPAMLLSSLAVIVTLTNVKYDYKYAVFFFLCAYLIIFSYYLFSGHQLVDFMISIFSVIYVAMPLILIMLLAMRKDNLIYLIFILAISSDSFAFFVGKYFGKTKLIKKISPKKTVEGSIGGIVGCVLTTLIFRFVAYNQMSVMAAIVIGIIGSIVSQIGDLTASKIKRYCKIKDFGKIMPGHGGVLDRIDSILFTATFVFSYYWLFFVY